VFNPFIPGIWRRQLASVSAVYMSKLGPGEVAEGPRMQQAADKPILYTYFRSSCSWRVRICLELAELSVDQVPVHLVKNEQHDQDYSQKNPMEQVPTFVMGDLVLTQSVAIMEYINEIRPEANILPRDPVLRAKVRMLTEMIVSGIQPIQNLAVLQKLSKEQVERAAWARHWITTGFVALEKVLETTAGDCCVGDEITMADCCLVPQVFNANRFSVDMSQFPTISRLNETLSQKPQFKAAHPSKQQDCPAELR